MPVNHNKNFIFIHIPKTGGTSIYQALGIEDNTYNFIGGHKDFLFNTTYILQHLPAKQIQQAIPDVFEKYYKFSFVRNPFDRVISIYESAKRFGLCRSSFEYFVKHELIPLKESPHHNINCHYIDQYDYLFYDNKCLVDQVFQYEQFGQNLKMLMEKFEFTGEIPHLNKSYRNSDYYTDELQNIVKTQYQKDFNEFY